MALSPQNQSQLDQRVLNFKASKLANFNELINLKIENIANYLTKANISNVVVGVSGGIDSAVVIALLAKVKERKMPHLNILGYTIHFELYDGIFEHKYVDSLIEAFEDKVTFELVDASKSFKLLLADMGIKANNHVEAQASYALRYQMLFTYAQVHKAVTIGTTNLDEFKYAGWFGKNSDMVVDLQVITDWHKFQVVEAAKILGVPDAIINRKPVGDLLDRSTDEQNFGCSYDELAYFTENLMLNWQLKMNPFLNEKYTKLRILHQKNIHKYQGQTFNPFFIK